jgi:hypothetical protein
VPVLKALVAVLAGKLDPAQVANLVGDTVAEAE